MNEHLWFGHKFQNDDAGWIITSPQGGIIMQTSPGTLNEAKAQLLELYQRKHQQTAELLWRMVQDLESGHD